MGTVFYEYRQLKEIPYFESVHLPFRMNNRVQWNSDKRLGCVYLPL